MRRKLALGVFIATAAWISGSSVNAQPLEAQLVNASRSVLAEMTAAPEKAMPQAMLTGASGIAIIPNVLKGSFVIGVRHGRGVLLLRDAHGGWTGPQFISLTGGSFGWQAGIQSTDLILVFKTPSSVQGLMNGKITIGADVAAAAGPIGRNAAVATDAQLRAEIYSYSRSRGLFAGVALDGSSVQMDRIATANYYGRPGGLLVTPGQPQQVPPEATALVQTVFALTQQSVAAVPRPIGAAGIVRENNDAQLRQLVAASARLQAILDPQWQDYLALPNTVVGRPQVDAVGLEETLRRFDKVVADPQYAAIVSRPEFQNAHSLLRRLVANSRQQVALPPPPAP